MGQTAAAWPRALRTVAERLAAARSRGRRARSRAGPFRVAELRSRAVVRRRPMAGRQRPVAPGGATVGDGGDIAEVGAGSKDEVVPSRAATPRPLAQAARQVGPAARVRSAVPRDPQARRWRRSWCNGSSRRDRSAAPHAEDGEAAPRAAHLVRRLLALGRADELTARGRDLGLARAEQRRVTHGAAAAVP